jgi:uncharacterized protein (TIGR02217 family)
MFFEAEFPRAIEFEQDGGPAFNTEVIAVQSGQEQRNRNWINTGGDYTASVVGLQNPGTSSAAFIDAVRAFFLMIGGMGDAFRYFDPIDNTAVGEAMLAIAGTSNLQWQLQKTYTLGGRTYIRTITKPITASVIDYQGNAMVNTVTIHASGGTLTSIDHTTGIALFSVAPSSVTADFQYHIPVRLTTDKFTPKVSKSGKGNRIVRWNLGLVIVRPPNY